MRKALLKRWLDQVPFWDATVGILSAAALRTYVVGGSVRDALLERPGHDVDIAVAGEAMALARRVADALGGAYVPLDAEHDVARVVIFARGDQYHLDFAGLRAEDIEGDLWARDYTINAMAVAVDDGLGEFYDPTGGESDLASGLLRITQDRAFADDPVRILRGLRLRGILGFSLTPETERLARHWLFALARVSAERIRDEVLQILDLPCAVPSLRYGAELGLFRVVLPELGPYLERALETLAALERSFSGEEENDDVGHFRPFCNDLRSHWAEKLAGGRSRWTVLKLAAMLSIIPEAEDVGARVAKGLRLSTKEVHFVGNVIRGSLCGDVWKPRGRVDALTAHRFFRELGAAGVDAAVTAAAGRLAADGVHARDLSLEETIARGRGLLDAWFKRRAEIVEPQPLLSGHDVIRILDVDPGPIVGRALRRLTEAQVEGRVETKAEGVAYLRQVFGAESA
ncbi:MAG: hypothetical protein U9R48_03045 [Chloroflexota bacterium]|nr:hypothetical protein [Chloroflexota bacterium]